MPRFDFDNLTYSAGIITNPAVAYLLEDICTRISMAGKLSATASNQIELLQKLGINFDTIEAELTKRLKRSRKDLDQLFRDYAAEHYAADYERLKLSFIPFEDNTGLQQIVAAYTRLADDTLNNATKTLGMIGENGKVMPWRKFYVSACQSVNDKVVLGAMDYNTAVREASKNLAAKGIRTINYESGVHTSLEAAVRRNVMGFLGLMAEEISLYNHEQIGANGWEMSAHARSAEDHEPYQGKQYTDAEWIRLNGKPPKQGDPANKPEVQGILKRRVGTLNCGHAAFPIILGVNSPQYTPEQLQKLKTDNEKGFTYETDKGKQIHYTGYEATQRMREIERTIRSWEKEYTTAVFTENPEQTQIASSNLVRWRQEYARFSKAAGLRQQVDRNFVAGFYEATRKAAKIGFVVPRMK